MLSRLDDYIGPMLAGASVTLIICMGAILLGFLAGVALHSLRDTGARGAVAFTNIYLGFFRGTPLLVQLLMLFYIPIALGVELNPYVAAVIALGLNSGAYQAEILRAGFQGIPKGQVEAADSVGIPRWKTLWHIQIPQVLRLTVPQLVSETADIIKASAIVSVITVTDLLRVGRQIVASNYRPLEVFITVAILYLVLISIVQIFGRYLEARWKVKA
ncbi:amino acid ABC transporter permease [Castellaniella sp. WN]